MLVAALILASLSSPQAGPGPEREALLARCAECHPSECASYARTGMARALEPLRAGEFAGLAPLAEPGTGFVYSFEGDAPSARLVESYAGGTGGADGAAGDERAAGPERAPWRDSAALAFATFGLFVGTRVVRRAAAR